ncbi:kinase-like domain-containing protein [Cokeromyces recurvatus]|uniref:kinase-like domain-containing protein n=1 Tax=Cokeromyces recurvatus TaxID=90255 RepID=UPI00221EDCA0|nr:kinase-like domain-containing protein [Cokeromyces recurvatus]KAI7908213.1 kinase-like domain-containing protein [Cokeromyces recurvatus]
MKSSNNYNRTDSIFFPPIITNYVPFFFRYEVLDLMGQGSFGQVVKCRTLKTNELVAIKIVKNQPTYNMYGDKEVEILCKLRDSPEHKERFLQLKNSFVFRGHRCAVFELLDISLYKYLHQKPGKAKLVIQDIQKIAFHILETLDLLKDMRIIHTDLKPDNILLKSQDNVHDVKLIDYGSAFFETDTLNYHIQTAFYRSPEVILQMEFGCAIDMWSFGCFIAELFLGKPLFSSDNEVTLMHVMVTTLDCFPPDHMLHQGKRSSEFFHFPKRNKKVSHNPPIRLLHPHKSSHHTTLEQKIMEFESDDSYEDRKMLYDFLKHILIFDPVERYSPRQALKHSFITTSMLEHVPLATMYASLTKTINTPPCTMTTKDLLPKKSILKRSHTPTQQPENTLDSKVAFLFQQQPPMSIVDSHRHSSMDTSLSSLVGYPSSSYYYPFTTLNNNNNRGLYSTHFISPTINTNNNNTICQQHLTNPNSIFLRYPSPLLYYPTPHIFQQQQQQQQSLYPQSPTLIYSTRI